LVSILAYLVLAVRLIEKDKTAYIYDNTAALIETVAEEVASGFLGALKTMRLAGLAFDGESRESAEATVRALFAEDDNFVALTVLSEQGDGARVRLVGLISEAYLSPYGEPASLVARANELAAVPGELLSAQEFQVKPVVVGKKLPLLKLAIALKNAEGQTMRI